MKKQVSEQNTKSKTEEKVAKTEASAAKKNEATAEATEQPKAAKKIDMAKVRQALGKVTPYKDWILYAVALVAIVVFALQNSKLKEANKALQRDISAVKAQINNVDTTHTKQLDDNRKIYVFSMEDTVMALGMLENRRQFEMKVGKLNEEVRAAEKKVKGIKDKAVQSEYSEVYMKSLQIKRDNLIEEYEKQMSDLTKRINSALESIVVEQKLPVVWASKNIAVSTQEVIDITPEVVAKLQQSEAQANAAGATQK